MPKVNRLVAFWLDQEKSLDLCSPVNLMNTLAMIFDHYFFYLFNLFGGQLISRRLSTMLWLIFDDNPKSGLTGRLIREENKKELGKSIK